MKKHLTVLLFAVLLGLAACATNPRPLTTVVLVRHAEKVTEAGVKDPPLTAAGAARAAELARVLGDAGVNAIYVTPFTRTRQTAAPLAKALGLKVIEVEADAEYPVEMARRIRTDHAGGTVVVVGHSNTTPDVIRALGVANPPVIADSEYDDLFVVTLTDGRAPRLLTLRYGAAAR